MGNALRSSDRELYDIENVDLPHVDPDRRTGVRLVRPIGKGGICTVFLAEHHPSRGSGVIRQDAPARLAIKLLQPGVLQRFRRLNLDARTTVRREWLALNRVMDRPIPTELVVGIYGNGDTCIELSGREFELPWLALEYVDGGSEGTTLSERVRRAGQRDGGVDPVRAFRLADRLSQGVQILHELEIVHKDLKPDNIFVSGPIDNETPKIGDCGIATVPGVSNTVYGVMTQPYGGPEQTLSACFPTRANPVLGPWTDVYALSALLWFIVAGEDWHIRDGDGRRAPSAPASLGHTRLLHEGYQRDPQLLARLDAALRQGAALRLPNEAWQRAGAAQYRAYVEKERPELLSGDQRYATVAELWRTVAPLLKEAADGWRQCAQFERRAAAAFRSTHPLDPDSSAACRVIQSSTGQSERFAEAVLPEQLAMHVDGRMLAKVGPRLVHLLSADRSSEVAVPTEVAEHVASAKWITRGPRDGYAIWTQQRAVLLSDTGFQPLALPPKATGAIEAVLGDGRCFAVVCGGELWRWRATDWEQNPVELHLSRIDKLVSGPDGLTVAMGVGTRPGKPSVAMIRLNGVTYPNIPGLLWLHAGVCGAAQTWLAGEAGTVFQLAPEGVTTHNIDWREPAIDMGLDPVGVPWLLSAHSVFRQVGSRWAPCFETPSDSDPFIAMGFTPAGAHLVSDYGHVTVLEPSDIGDWQRG